MAINPNMFAPGFTGRMTDLMGCLHEMEPVNIDILFLHFMTNSLATVLFVGDGRISGVSGGRSRKRTHGHV